MSDTGDGTFVGSSLLCSSGVLGSQLCWFFQHLDMSVFELKGSDSMLKGDSYLFGKQLILGTDQTRIDSVVLKQFLRKKFILFQLGNIFPVVP